jgi:hypothetical protein
LPLIRTIRFDTDRTALVAEIVRTQELSGVMEGLGLARPVPVLVLVGGADGLDETAARRLRQLLGKTLVPALRRLGATVIDGGTDAGVMGLMGRARSEANAGFPLLGVAARGTVRSPGNGAPAGGYARLEQHHSHFILVPGEEWGDEAPWISAAADELSQGRGGATLVAGGGRITRLDLELSLLAGRPAILLAGSGGTADAAVEALQTGDLAAIGIDSGRAALLRVVHLDSEEAGMTELLDSLLAVRS